MSQDLLAALCLVLVIEGVVLLGVPDAWKRLAQEIGEMPDRVLRIVGAVMITVGLVALQLVR